LRWRAITITLRAVTRSRQARALALLSLFFSASGGLDGCGDDDGENDGAEAAAPAEEPPRPGETPEEARARRLNTDWPMYGAVTGTQIRVYAEASSESTTVGWLRVGSVVRMKREVTRASGCRGGFRRLHPTGYVCVGDGVEVRESAIEIEAPSDEGWKNGQVETARTRGALVLPATARDAPLPYDYYLVKEPAVPEYHRLPSRNEQRAALAKSEHYLALLARNEREAARYLAGETGGPPGTAIVSRYLDRGFFVAVNGYEVRASRRFARTTQGRFIKTAQLEPRTGGDFHGVELGDERTLPVAWATRTSRPLVKRDGADGAIEWVDDESAEPIERQTFLEGWQRRENIGGSVMHVLEGDRYLQAWFASVADRIDRPSEVGADEPWVHVDLSEQTLVLYRGDTPVYATLVSTGIEGNATPTGLFAIRRKHVTDTMSNIGDEADDRYRIEDVPWTQYFEGSFALHAAFWHSRYGLPRSHGCVNMAPADAHRVFRATWPEVPEGWHGLSTEGTELHGSHVLVTE
jgi:hypothetical protein